MTKSTQLRAAVGQSAASARATCLRWVQSRHQHGSELRLALEAAIVDFDPRAFVAALDRFKGEIGPSHYQLGRKLGVRWQRLADAT